MTGRQGAEAASGPAAPRTVESAAAFDALVAASDVPLCIYFRADWAAQCVQMDTVVKTLAKRNKGAIEFVQLDAEDVPEVSEKFAVSLVPSFLFLDRGGNVKDRFEGADTKQVTQRVKRLLVPEVAMDEHDAAQLKQAALTKRIKALVHSAKCIVFIKGVPDAPRCKFSRELVDILAEQEVEYASFDILSDQDVRQALKTYSDWPTYPQVYVGGEFVGGLDVIKASVAAGEFEAPKKPATVPLEERLKRLIAGAPVMLFMKGVPGEPRCGFSSKIVKLLNDNAVEFSSFDILTDDDVRQGLKTYSDWPTFPQLYINGTLIGGLDIVQEMIEDGTFKDELTV